MTLSLRALTRFLYSYRDQWLPLEVLQERQWFRLKRILQHAFDRSPFYRHKFREAGIHPSDLQDASDLARVPITTREELHNSENLIASGYSASRMKCSLTSGSTGRVTRTYFDSQAWLMGKFFLKFRARFACGVRPWDKIAIFQEGLQANRWLRQRFFRQTRFSIFENIANILPELVRFSPTVLYGFPSYLLRLSETAHALISPRLIFTSGEMLDGDTRRTIESRFSAPILDVYGSTELKEIAWECPARHGYHINADWLVVETLKANEHERSMDGVLLVTSLYNFGMPLIRYEIGDTGRLLPSSCSCGRGLPLMTPCLGRSVDYFVLPSGAQVSPYEMTCAVEVVDGMRQYQIVQEAPSRVVVNVVPHQGIDGSTKQQIKSALGPILNGVELEVRFVDEIERERSGKYRIVMSQVTGN